MPDGVACSNHSEEPPNPNLLNRGEDKLVDQLESSESTAEITLETDLVELLGCSRGLEPLQSFTVGGFSPSMPPLSSRVRVIIFQVIFQAVKGF